MYFHFQHCQCECYIELTAQKLYPSEPTQAYRGQYWTRGRGGGGGGGVWGDTFFYRSAVASKAHKSWKSSWFRHIFTLLKNLGQFSRHRVGISSYITNLCKKQTRKKNIWENIWYYAPPPWNLLDLTRYKDTNVEGPYHINQPRCTCKYAFDVIVHTKGSVQTISFDFHLFGDNNLKQLSGYQNIGWVILK